MTLRPLAVSMGDPAGIGLEIAAKAWAARDAATPPFYLHADRDAVCRAGGDAIAIAAPEEAIAAFERGLPVIHAPLAEPETPGAPATANAPAVIAAIDCAVDNALAGRAAAVVTLPIAKAVLYAGGFRHPGHTEYVADRTRAAPFAGVRGPVMMLAAGGLRVALATIHAPLADVPTLLTRARIETTARVVLDALARDFGVVRPRLAFAALNPHAGEGGALGREEIEVIAPVVAMLSGQGHAVSGPHPADTLFHPDARARYDAVLAMYHDQGLIPIKALDFWGAANITLGLPVVRTSPDHGTGFDIAGQRRANPASFIAALRAAADIARRRAA